MDLPCSKSSNLVRGVKGLSCISKKLYVGCNYEICLFFGLPPTHLLQTIRSAKLVLFKVPSGMLRFSSTTPSNRYSVCPLLDFFSIYSNCHARPQTDDCLTVEYEDNNFIGCTEIDITEIVEAWIRGAPENKGLLLTAAPDAWQLAFASDQYEVGGMRPMLRLMYEGAPNPLSVAPCVVTVNGM